LVLMPEIALSEYMLKRLKSIMGRKIAIFHSGLGWRERTELFRKVADGSVRLIVGPRSAIFLPFQDLRGIVVDEEHDPSYKQVDPAPRYQARDSAMMLAKLCGAKVLLGSATPAVETWYHAKNGRYGYVHLPGRFHDAGLPNIHVNSLKEARKKNKFRGLLTLDAAQSMEHHLAQGRQAIIFQNRRGFAPVMLCQECGHQFQCRQCDITLYYHQKNPRLECHYCGTRYPIPEVCPNCQSGDITVQGTGTEKIEESLRILYPAYSVARLDQDIAGGKRGHQEVLRKLDAGEIRILTGTQMVSKGLDAEKLGFVGVLNADALWNFSEFRSNERAFQMLVQVSGRAGRRNEPGDVWIQTYFPEHPVIQALQANQTVEFLDAELRHRQQFSYPPFTRIIQVMLRHRKEKWVQQGAIVWKEWLEQVSNHHFDGQLEILGPVVPSVGRVKNYYLRMMMIKIPVAFTGIGRVKTWMTHLAHQLTTQKGLKSIQIVFDVDPL